MQLPPTPKDTATAALGVPVGLWIDRHRTSPPRLSYRQIAAVLADETGVIVTREALRQWHVAYTTRAA